MTTHFSCADTAKLVRKALWEAFPEIKFNVRSKTYSMGASITVHWTDGPVASQVEPVIKPFEGAGFDPSQDLKFYYRKTKDGLAASFGADFIFTSHSISKERRDAVIEILNKIPHEMWLEYAVKMQHPFPTFIMSYYGAPDFADSLLRNCPPILFEGHSSPLAETIITTGDTL